MSHSQQGRLYILYICIHKSWLAINFFSLSISLSFPFVHFFLSSTTCIRFILFVFCLSTVSSSRFTFSQCVYLAHVQSKLISIPVLYFLFLSSASRRNFSPLSSFFPSFFLAPVKTLCLQTHSMKQTNIYAHQYF